MVVQRVLTASTTSYDWWYKQFLPVVQTVLTQFYSFLMVFLAFGFVDLTGMIKSSDWLSETYLQFSRNTVISSAKRI